MYTRIYIHVISIHVYYKSILYIVRIFLQELL